MTIGVAATMAAGPGRQAEGCLMAATARLPRSGMPAGNVLVRRVGGGVSERCCDRAQQADPISAAQFTSRDIDR